MTDYLLRNACVFDPAHNISQETRDIAIVNGRIADEPSTNAEIIECAALLVRPGGS